MAHRFRQRRANKNPPTEADGGFRKMVADSYPFNLPSPAGCVMATSCSHTARIGIQIRLAMEDFISSKTWEDSTAPGFPVKRLFAWKQ